MPDFAAVAMASWQKPAIDGKPATDSGSAVEVKACPRAPARTVQIFHLVDPRVEQGEHMCVSHTITRGARLFPFRS